MVILKMRIIILQPSQGKLTYLHLISLISHTKKDLTLIAINYK